MTVKIFRALLSIVALTMLASACGGGARNHKLTGVTPKGGGPTGNNQKAAAVLDKWIELERKKTDSDFNKSTPDQSTVGMSVTAIKAYKKMTAKGDLQKKNQTLQERFPYVDIRATKKDSKLLTVNVSVYNAKAETTRKLIFQLTGDIDAEKGGGELIVEMKDKDEDSFQDKKAVDNKIKNKTPVKKESYTGDVKCFDKDCYNLLVRIFDNKVGGFLAYFYRVVDIVDQTSDVKAKISSVVWTAIEKYIEKNKRPDTISTGDFEKDGYHLKLELSFSKFNLKSIYSLSLVNSEFINFLQISDPSNIETSKIQGSGFGAISDSSLEEYTVLLKKK